MTTEFNNIEDLLGDEFSTDTQPDIININIHGLSTIEVIYENGESKYGNPNKDSIYYKVLEVLAKDNPQKIESIYKKLNYDYEQVKLKTIELWDLGILYSEPGFKYSI